MAESSKATLRMRPATKPLLVRLTDEERALLIAYATRNDLRLGQAVRRFIREHAAPAVERAA